ncbi:MAG: hypothetical protein V8R61_08020 [Enterocloster sp.]
MTMRKQLETVEEKLAKNQKILRREFMMRYISYAEQGNVRKEIAHYRNGFLPEAGMYRFSLLKQTVIRKKWSVWSFRKFNGIWECFPVLTSRRCVEFAVK